MVNKHNNELNQEKPIGNLSRPSLTIDYDLYQHYLDNSDLTDAQKREFLDALWSIIVSFVDLGFGVHPLQQISDANEGECGQLDISAEFLPAQSSDVIECNLQSKSQFENAANRQIGLPDEGSQK